MNPRNPERAVLLAPTEADARITAAMATEAGLECVACANIQELVARIGEGAGVVVATDQTLGPEDLGALAACLNHQPAWSDLPVLLLTGAGSESAYAAGALARLSNLTILERPVRATVLVSALRTAVRARRRQYELRDRLEALDRAREQLRTKNAELTAYLETAAIGLQRLGPDGVILWANEAAHSLLGYARHEYIGRGLAEFCAEPVRAAPVLASLAGGARLHGVPLRLSARDGSAKVVLVDSSPFLDQGLLRHTQCFVVDITQRVHAEESVRELKNHLQAQVDELERSEARLGALALAVPSIVWNAAPDGSIAWANERWREYTGLEPDGAADWANLLHPGDAGRFVDCWNGSRRDGTDFECEARHRRRDGEYRWFLTRALPLRGPDGAVAAWWGSSTDIHDRKLAEHAIERRNRRLALLSQASADLLALADWEGAVRRVFELIAPEFELGVYFNYLLDDERGTLTLDSWAGIPEGRAENVRTLEMGAWVCGAVAQARERAVLEGVQGSDDPRAGPIRALGVRAFVCTPLLAGDRLLGTLSFGTFSRDRFEPEEIEFLTAVCHYIALAGERLRAEGQLRESEGRFRALVEASAQVVWTARADGSVVEDSRSWREFTGQTYAQWKGFGRFDAIHPEDRARVRELWRNALDSRRTIETEYRLRRADGAYRWVAVRVVPLIDGEGNLRNWVGMHTDIEARRQAEAALRESRDVLSLAMRAGRMGAWWKDVGTGRVWWSPELVEIFGLPAGYQPPPGGGIFDLIHDDDRDAMNRVVERAVESGGDYVIEFRFRHASGEWRWMEGRGRCIMPVDGGPARLFGLGIDITDRKGAEQDRAFLAAIVRHSDDAMLSKSLDGIITSWNGAAVRLFGYSADEAIGRPATMLIPADRRDEEERILSKIRRGERVEQFDTVRVGRDGTAIDVSVAISPIRDDSGRIIGASSVSRDITARKRTEEALRRSETNFRTLADNMSQLAWMCDELGYADWYNRRWYEYTGTTWEQMQGSGWTALHHPDHAERVKASIRRARELGVPWEDTFPLRGRDGSFRWFLSRAVPIRDGAGAIIRWFGTNTDITEQREAAELLRSSEERFRLMADASPALVWVSGPDHARTWFNRPWLEFTGRTLEQEAAEEWRAGVHPEDLPRFVETVTSATQRRGEYRVEYRLRRHDGQYRWLLEQGRPFLVAGVFSGYVGSCIDVTDQVLARQSLERQQVVLEETVHQRTLELERSSQRLRMSARMASLGTLSAGLGHDMGNLLVPIRVRLDSLSRAELSPELREDVEAIRASAQYLQRLAGGLRMLAIDPSREGRAESVELGTWWSEAGPLLRNAVPRGIAIEAPSFPPGLSVSMLRAALTQVVFNLVQNAGEAMRARGTGRITITAGPVDGRVRVSVADDGPGMTEEVLARCFEPFFTTKTRTLSTGLGLALVYRLVTEAGGTIEPESRVGEGTTFSITLPPGGGPAPAGPGHGRTARVLVRDERMRAFITAELKSLAFEVRTNGDGRSADLLVGDDADVELDGPTGVVLLCDQGPARPGVVAVGRRPSPRAVRDAIDRLTRGDARVDR